MANQKNVYPLIIHASNGDTVLSVFSSISNRNEVF